MSLSPWTRLAGVVDDVDEEEEVLGVDVAVTTDCFGAACFGGQQAISRNRPTAVAVSWSGGVPAGASSGISVTNSIIESINR